MNEKDYLKHSSELYGLYLGESLKHYQVKGAHHGVRRYQNEDGSLTPLGRDHYGIGPAREKKTREETKNEKSNNSGSSFKSKMSSTVASYKLKSASFKKARTEKKAAKVEEKTKKIQEKARIESERNAAKIQELNSKAELANAKNRLKVTERNEMNYEVIQKKTLQENINGLAKAENEARIRDLINHNDEVVAKLNLVTNELKLKEAEALLKEANKSKTQKLIEKLGREVVAPSAINLAKYGWDKAIANALTAVNEAGKENKKKDKNKNNQQNNQNNQQNNQQNKQNGQNNNQQNGKKNSGGNALDSIDKEIEKTSKELNEAKKQQAQQQKNNITADQVNNTAKQMAAKLLDGNKSNPIWKAADKVANKPKPQQEGTKLSKNQRTKLRKLAKQPNVNYEELAKRFNVDVATVYYYANKNDKFKHDAFDDPNYLEHYGVLGMHWGVRRYQNYDGTYTQKGLEHLRKNLDRADSARKNAEMIKSKYSVKVDKNSSKANKASTKAFKQLQKGNYDKSIKLSGKEAKYKSKAENYQSKIDKAEIAAKKAEKKLQNYLWYTYQLEVDALVKNNRKMDNLDVKDYARQLLKNMEKNGVTTYGIDTHLAAPFVDDKRYFTNESDMNKYLNSQKDLDKVRIKGNDPLNVKTVTKTSEGYDEYKKLASKVKDNYDKEYKDVKSLYDRELKSYNKLKSESLKDPVERQHLLDLAKAESHKSRDLTKAIEKKDYNYIFDVMNYDPTLVRLEEKMDEYKSLSKKIDDSYEYINNEQGKELDREFNYVMRGSKRKNSNIKTGKF